MLTRARVQLLIVILLLAPGAALAQTPAERWTSALAAFDAADAASPPTHGDVLFLGSSTIVSWNLAKAFPTVRTINRGVWSASIDDFVMRVDRLVVPYAPRVIVLYAGDNDINAGATSEQVAVEFERFAFAVQARLPDTRIVFIGLKPSPQRWRQIHRMRAANDLIREFCAHDDRLAFVDVDNAMLGWDEKPRPELFLTDGLHLSAQGYELWSALVAPFLR